MCGVRTTDAILSQRLLLIKSDVRKHAFYKQDNIWWISLVVGYESAWIISSGCALTKGIQSIEGTSEKKKPAEAIGCLFFNVEAICFGAWSIPIPFSVAKLELTKSPGKPQLHAKTFIGRQNNWKFLSKVWGFTFPSIQTWFWSIGCVSLQLRRRVTCTTEIYRSLKPKGWRCWPDDIHWISWYKNINPSL